MAFRSGGFGGRGGGARGGRGAPRGGRGGGDRGRGGFSRGGGRGGGRGAPGGRGGARGRGGISKGRGGGGAKPKGGAVTVTAHRHPGVFLAHSKGHDEIVTKSVAPGISVYMEKRFTADFEVKKDDGTAEIEKAEFRYWNPFRSKLCAAIVSGIANTYIKPGSKVLYLGAASGTTVSHVADMVGETGMVIAVEFAERPGVDLLNMTSKRRRVAPVVADARKPDDYRMMVPGMVDCIFADVAQPDPVRIVALNASRFLKHGGGVLITIKANCVDSTAPPAKVYASQVELMKQMGLKPKEQLDLGQFQRGHAMIVGEMNAQDLKASATSEE